MAEKDIVEKTLEGYNDVFADIVNVLLFDGKRLIDPDDLEDMTTHSVYKADGKFHDQDRDVAKTWKNGIIRLASIGIENQTAIDAQMALRVIGYDGAAYRARYMTESARCPMVTFVLYFGTEKKWADEISLKEFLDIPEDLEDYVNDYRIKVFSIAYLPRETINKFTSDFRIVADYFVQQRTKRKYIANQQVLTHVQETLELLSVMGCNHKILERYNSISNSINEGGIKTMTGLLDQILDERGEQAAAEGLARGLKKGLEKGLAKGLAEGRAEGDLSATIRYYRKGYLTLNQAASELGLTVDEFTNKMNSFQSAAM